MGGQIHCTYFLIGMQYRSTVLSTTLKEFIAIIKFRGNKISLFCEWKVS